MHRANSCFILYTKVPGGACLEAVDAQAGSVINKWACCIFPFIWMDLLFKGLPRRMQGQNVERIDFHKFSAFHIVPPVIFHSSSAENRRGSPAPSSGQEVCRVVAHRLLVLKRESWILGVAQSSHSFWRVSAALWAGCNLRRMAGAPAAAWLLGRHGRWGGALICAPDQWRNQLLIHKELLISQPGSSVSAVPINGQCAGKLPRSFCAPGFSRSLRVGDPQPPEWWLGEAEELETKHWMNLQSVVQMGLVIHSLYIKKRKWKLHIYGMWVLLLN